MNKYKDIEIGGIYLSKHNGEFTVVSFENSRNITIRFTATGTIKKICGSQFEKGNVADPLAPKLIYGWGVNDAPYKIYTTELVRGKQVVTGRCPYYSDWVGMLMRCFSNKLKTKHPAYADCFCDVRWKHFSDFKRWVEEQPNKNWQNCELDKNILRINNKCYGPDTCVYVNRETNQFVKTSSHNRGKYLIGVHFHKRFKKFVAQCQNPEEGRGHFSRHIGYFDTELEAHKAWQAKKHEYACQLAELQEDPRVAEALRQRYAPDKDWTKE